MVSNTRQTHWAPTAICKLCINIYEKPIGHVPWYCHHSNFWDNISWASILEELYYYACNKKVVQSNRDRLAHNFR